jgi:hypothetical protein
MEDGGPNPMPSQNLGIDSQKDLLVRGNYQELSHLSCSPQEKLISVTSTMIINLICNGVVGIGEAKLGIEWWEVRTHSIRYGPAMAMYLDLAGVPIFSIMLIGQWSSTAFLNYIRKQVQEFSHGISSKMIEIQSFKHIQNPLFSNYPTSSEPTRTIVGDSFTVTVA